MALAVLAETDMIAALPRTFVALHAARFEVVAVEPPLPLVRFRLNAVMPAGSAPDAGLAWLFDRLAPAPPPSKRRSRRR